MTEATLKLLSNNSEEKSDDSLAVVESQQERRRKTEKLQQFIKYILQTKDLSDYSLYVRKDGAMDFLPDGDKEQRIEQRESITDTLFALRRSKGKLTPDVEEEMKKLPEGLIRTTFNDWLIPRFMEIRDEARSCEFDYVSDINIPMKLAVDFEDDDDSFSGGSNKPTSSSSTTTTTTTSATLGTEGSKNGSSRRANDKNEEEEAQSQVSAANDSSGSGGSGIEELLKALIQSGPFKKKAVGIVGQLMECMLEENVRLARQAFLNCNGTFIVVSMMEAHLEYEQLQLRGIQVLTKAMDGNANVKSQVMDMKGIQAICAAMTNFQSNDVKVASLEAFVNLTSHAPCAKTFVLETNGVACVVSTVKEVSDSVDIVQRACHVLSNLCSVEDLKKSLRDADIITALAPAFDGHKGDKSIQEHAGKAMKALLE